MALASGHQLTNADRAIQDASGRCKGTRIRAGAVVAAAFAGRPPEPGIVSDGAILGMASRNAGSSARDELLGSVGPDHTGPALLAAGCCHQLRLPVAGVVLRGPDGGEGWRSPASRAACRMRVAPSPSTISKLA